MPKQQTSGPASPPVIYYHAVFPSVPPGWKLHDELILKLRLFEAQLDFLKRSRFKSLFFDEWLAYRRAEKPLDRQTVTLAFDDGLLDNWVYAFPLAKKYGIRFTIFVCPECVDPRPIVRPTLEDVWQGRCQEAELDGLGFASWEELRLMQESGYVDIQSHTMSHLKYAASPSVAGYYYGGAEGIYPILAAHPEIKPRYMADPDFSRRLPLGTPLFAESSAVIARIHRPAASYVEEVQAMASRFDLSAASQRPAFEQEAEKVRQDYLRAGSLIEWVEPEADYRARVAYEVVESKRILEEQLRKPVHFLCWPHGDNTEENHRLARQSGYLATTSGKLKAAAGQPDRIPRFGAAYFRDNPWLTRLLFRYRIARHYQQEPYYTLSRFNHFKHRLLGKA